MLPGQIAYPGMEAGLNNTPQTVNLQSGAIWPVASPGGGGGSFMLKMGPQCVLQWYDQNSGLWRITDSGPSSHPLRVDSDGTNFRVVNISGTIQGINITNGGTGYVQGDMVTFSAPAAGTPSRTATGKMIIGGSLTFAVTSGGTGYSNPAFFIQPPNVCGGTPGLCLPAYLASCTVTAGVISSPTGGYAGAGYVTAPTVTVVDMVPPGVTPGTGAVITATVAGAGIWKGTVMTDYGAGYDGTHIPTLTFSTVGGASAAGTSLPSMALKSLTVGSTNTGYSASVVIETSEGSGAAAIAPINDEFVMPRPARATATQSGGVVATPLIEDAGNGFQTVPLAKQVGNATADGSVNATFTAVVGGVNNSLLYWQIG
jgi:hypothetical protein